MRFLRTVLAILVARWFWTLIGAMLLSLAIWNFGDLVSIGDDRVLGSDLRRLTAVLVVAIVWGLANLWQQGRARQNNQQFLAALAPAPTREAAAAPGAAELQELSRRFEDALAKLKGYKLGGFGHRRWLYELPWYVIIGPPGTGKTTALVQSGLRFPVTEADDLRGAAGTRYCDWLFTDQAVLIDTAGRYVTQDSDRTGDSAAWLGFLDLLRRHRPRQPLNGVLVALSVRDLLADGNGAASHAATIRARLAEIEARLQIRLPVYLVVTKADLLPGFTTMFDRLEERDREQVWGHSFPGAPGQPTTPDLAAIRRAIDDLVERLDGRLHRRLEEEEELSQRAAIFGFPAQLAALGGSLASFVEKCFSPAAYEHGAWLRGFYLTSGTQSGAPVDRLVGAITASLGLPDMPARPSPGDRSFFLTRLMQDVVFGEASLVGRNPRAERRQTLRRAGALASLAVFGVLLSGAWAWSFTSNASLQDGFATSLQAASEDFRPFGQTQLTTTEGDYLPVLPALDRLADLKTQMARGAPLSARLGLSRRSALADRASAAYDDALAHVLLPRLVLSLEASMRQRLGDPDYLLEALKAYLMLGNQAPMVADILASVFVKDAQYRGAGDNTTDSVRRHVSALPAALVGFSKYPTLDTDLETRARDVLNREPLSKRAYKALIAIPELAHLPGWQLTDHAGPSAGLGLVRRSGAPLGKPIPAVFTYDGFHNAILRLLDTQAQASYSEDWVLGGGQGPQANSAEIQQLKGDILTLYYDDMIAAWDALLADVTVAPLGPTPERQEAVTKALGGPNSPLKLFLKSAMHETDLLAPPPDKPAPNDPASAAAAAAGRLGTWLHRLAAYRPASEAATPIENPGAPVSAHFAALKQIVAGIDGAPPALDDTIAAFGAYHAAAAQAVLAPGAPDVPAKMLAAGAALKQALATAPDPLRQMVAPAGGKVDAHSKAAVRQQLNNAWDETVLTFCRRTVAGRFPFTPGSTLDASLEDLSRLFGKSGAIEGFLAGPAAPYIDSSRESWADSQQIGLSRAALGQLALARKIGQRLMGAGASPRADFWLKLEDLSPGLASVSVDLDGTKFSFDTGPAVPRPYTWPGPGGTNLVRITFTKPDGEPKLAQLEGPWAFFHLARLAPSGASDRFNAIFTADGASARFDLRAGSVDNPFDLRLFQRFSCPEVL